MTMKWINECVWWWVDLDFYFYFVIWKNKTKSVDMRNGQERARKQKKTFTQNLRYNCFVWSQFIGRAKQKKPTRTHTSSNDGIVWYKVLCERREEKFTWNCIEWAHTVRAMIDEPKKPMCFNFFCSFPFRLNGIWFQWFDSSIKLRMNLLAYQRMLFIINASHFSHHSKNKFEFNLNESRMGYAHNTFVIVRLTD